MSRESCIKHPAKQRMAVVKEIYKELTGKAGTAAILSLFEYWANGAIAANSNLASADIIPVGAKPISEFEEMLLGLASEKCIRNMLKKLEDLGFIVRLQQATTDRTMHYGFCVDAVQAAIDRMEAVKLPDASGKSTGWQKPDQTQPQQESQSNFPSGKSTASSYINSNDQYLLTVGADAQASENRPSVDFDQRKYAPSVVKSDRLFSPAPWGSYDRPDPAFAQWVIENHLKRVNPYKEMLTVGMGHFKEWLRKAKYSEERFEQAIAKWEQYQETQGSKVQSQSLEDQIWTELSRLNLRNALPLEWEIKSGKRLMTQLTAEQKGAYLNWLQKQQEVAA